MARPIVKAAGVAAAALAAATGTVNAQVRGQSAIGDGSQPTTVQTQTTAPATATVAWRCGRDVRNPATQICDNNYGETVRVGADEAMRLQGLTQGRGYAYEESTRGRLEEARNARDIAREQRGIYIDERQAQLEDQRITTDINREYYRRQEDARRDQDRAYRQQDRHCDIAENNVRGGAYDMRRASSDAARADRQDDAYAQNLGKIGAAYQAVVGLNGFLTGVNQASETCPGGGVGRAAQNVAETGTRALRVRGGPAPRVAGY